MDVSPTPSEPGWYWDPQELAFNTWLREQWISQGLYLGAENVYRLRRWDGQRWTDDTLRGYVTRGRSSFPHTAGPTTRIHVITPEASRRAFRVWAVLMVLASVGALLLQLLR
jgi:hypothetical protein